MALNQGRRESPLVVLVEDFVLLRICSYANICIYNLCRKGDMGSEKYIR